MTVGTGEKPGNQKSPRRKEIEDSRRQKEGKRTLVKVTLTLVFVHYMSDLRLWKGLQILNDQLGEISKFPYKRARERLARIKKGKKDPPLSNTLWRARPRKMKESPIQGGETLKNSTRKVRMRVCHH